MEEEFTFYDDLNKQPERKKEVMKKMAADYGRIISHSPGEGLHWRGTKLDLIEMAHVAFVHGSLRDPMGSPLSFATLVRRGCAVFGLAVPRNPRAYAEKARQRKGIFQCPFSARYAWQLYRNDNCEPMGCYVDCGGAPAVPSKKGMVTLKRRTRCRQTSASGR